MQSLWKDTVTLPTFPALSGNQKVEAAVIGAGMAGILTAYLLRQKGINTVILESDTVGSGQTGKTTAKITSQHGVIYSRLIEEQGRKAAQEYARCNEQAIAEYEKIVKGENIACEFERLPAYLYTHLNPEVLKKEADAAASLGIAAALTDKTDLPFPVACALRFEGQAQFHPLKFLNGILKDLKIYEKTRVLKVEENKVITDKGDVTADKIIFACHYPFINIPGYYFMRQHQERSYVIALEKAENLDGMYLGIDEDDSFSFRNGGGLLLLGGGGHRTGENRTGGKYELLRKRARELYPESYEKYCWSAQDCIPMDGIPYIGRFAASRPDWYAATGFQKWGMTSSMVAAMKISESICGNSGEDTFGIFSPLRFTPEASAGNFCKDSIHAVKDLTRRIFAPSRGDIEELPQGHGGVMEYDGEKVGVYKAEDGEVYLVSVKCPHMGCQLEWNPDEKSWDCPCHGFRFDYKGNILDGPSQTSLKEK